MDGVDLTFWEVFVEEDALDALRLVALEEDAVRGMIGDSTR